MSIEFLSFSRWRTSRVQSLRKVDGLGLGIALLIGAVVGGLLILPISQEMSELDQQIATESRVLKRAAAIERSHKMAVEEQAAQNEKLVRLITLVPTQPDEEKFLAEISILAQNSGLQLRQFQPQEARPVDQYREIPIRVAATGSYAAMCRFLYGFQNLSRLAEVVNLRLGLNSSGPPGEEMSALLLDLNVKIYYQTETKAKP